MKTSRLLAIALLTLPVGNAAAQACVGTVGSPPANNRAFYVGGTGDFVNSTNAFGGRFGFLRSSASGKPTFGYLGARSLDGGSKSILTAEFMFGGALMTSANDQSQLCAFAGVEAVNLSDSENGVANVPFGLSFGHAIPGSSVSVVPFGAAWGNLASTGESTTGDFSMWLEGGIGLRFGNGFTVTPSMRQSMKEGAEPIIRVLAMIPFGQKATTNK